MAGETFTFLPLFLVFSPLQAAEKCFPVVGCFNMDHPWSRMKKYAVLPDHPQNISTFMYYHNRTTPSEGIKFTIFPEIELSSVPFKVGSPTFVIIHTYTSSGLADYISAISKALLKRIDANIFVCDYSPGAKVQFPKAIGNARVVAKLSALVLEATNISPSDIHIIGYSLGAHIAGLIGKFFNEKGKKLRRITGLDPTGGVFELQEPQVVLDSSDAELVVVLHTNSAVFGMIAPCGHIDFYFNGGVNQPGCNLNALCSHGRATEYFVEALNGTCMRGRPAVISSGGSVPFSGLRVVVRLMRGCSGKGCPPVGLETGEYSDHGTYDVRTNDKPPFCIPPR